MKKFILTSVAAMATLAFVACSSDSSSSSGSSTSMKADLQIDEDAQLFTMTFTEDVEKCIKDGGDFVWKNLGTVQ